MTGPANTGETQGLSPKMVWASVVTTIVGVVIALLNGLVANAALLGALDPVLQFIIITAVPPVLVGLAAYQAKPGDVR